MFSSIVSFLLAIQAALNTLELLDGVPAVHPEPASDPVASIMLTERDTVLSQSCCTALAESPPRSCVIAVVGEAHLPGMQLQLRQAEATASSKVSAPTCRSDDISSGSSRGEQAACRCVLRMQDGCAVLLVMYVSHRDVYRWFIHVVDNNSPWLSSYLCVQNAYLAPRHVSLDSFSLSLVPVIITCNFLIVCMNSPMSQTLMDCILLQTESTSNIHQADACQCTDASVSFQAYSRRWWRVYCACSAAAVYCRISRSMPLSSTLTI